MFKPKNDGRPAEGRIEITKMKKILLSVSMLLALAFAPVSCDREKAEYGDGQQPVGTATGTLSLAAMTVVLSTETETHDAVVRPDAAAATSAPAASGRLQTAARAEAETTYTCTVTDAAGAAVAQFPYDRRPETLTLPAGAYTLTVESAEPKAAVWDAPVYAARQEVLIDRNATVEVGEVLCTPAAVGVALVFDPAFGTQSTATVDCGGEALAFTTSESRTGWFAVGTARTLTLTVEGTAGEGTPVSFTRRYTDVQAGQLYRFTVKGESLSAPDIEWVGHDTSQRYEANDELEAQIVVTAAAGIRAFTVEIISEEVLTPEVLDAVGLAPKLDLVSPGDYKEPLEGLGFPTGEKVVGQTSVSFDISPFMPLIPLLGTGDSDFRLTVTDNEGQTTVASIMVHSTRTRRPRRGVSGRRRQTAGTAPRRTTLSGRRRQTDSQHTKNNHNPMIMKQNITNFGGGSKTYLRPEVTATEVVVETGFAASEAFPGGNAKPFDAWGDRVFDAYGDPIEE